MPKAPRAENLIQLMEWLRLGKKFHIHKEFLKYLKMSDTIRLCVVSKHYNKKYLNYCYNYFLSSCSPVLHIIKSNTKYSCYPIEELLHFEKTCLLNKLLYHPHVLLYYPRTLSSYGDFCELKSLYGKNQKISKRVNRYFESISV